LKIFPLSPAAWPMCGASSRRPKARRTGQSSTRTILFVDEIHRFNRAQQDAFLPNVEDGTVTLIGATTENPLATVNTPLLSRCRLFRFEPLDEDELVTLLERALHDQRGLAFMQLEVQPEALRHIARQSLGDARSALNALEMSADLAGRESSTRFKCGRRAVGRRALEYDKGGDAHYHIISAYIKSLRGGDADAALYWMARMLESGEDPMFVARRLVIQASEDVGNANPQALPLAMAALQAVEKIGMPEAAIPLAQATVYVATSPKSNASYVALAPCSRLLCGQQPPAAVPMHLRAASLRGARERLGEGVGYIYPHDEPGGIARQEYLPPGFKTAPYYEPTGPWPRSENQRAFREPGKRLCQGEKLCQDTGVELNRKEEHSNES
jgi:putative ATPase